jgi:HEAT repeat protein
MMDDDLFVVTLDAIEDGVELSRDQLSSLAHMPPPSAERFAAVWRGLAIDRRIGLLVAAHTAESNSFRLDFNAVYEIAMADENAGVRLAATRSIVDDSAARLLPILQRLASGDPDPRVRVAALDAIGPYCLNAELGRLSNVTGDELRASLLATSGNTDEAADIRGAAIASVGYLDNDDVRDAIQRAFERPETRLAAIRAMGRTANPVWLGLITRETTSESPETRREAVVALGELGEEDATGIIADMIDDADPDVRLAAIAGLGRLGGDAAREALVYAAQDRRAEIREAAERAIEQLDADEDPFG